MDGNSLRWLWPAMPDLNLRFAQMTGDFVAMAYMVFLWLAFDGLWFSPRLQKLTVFLLVGGVAVNTIIFFIPQTSIGTVLTTSYGSVSSMVVTYTMIIAVIKRVPIAKSILVAGLLNVMSSTSLLLSVRGIIPPSELTQWVMHAGILLEGMLLSLVLAARTRIAQLAAIENLQKYETIYHDSIEGRFEFSSSDNALKCNDAFAHMFGFDKPEDIPVEMNILQKFPAENRKELPRRLNKHGFVKDYESEIELPTGQSIWVSITMRTLADEKEAMSRVEGSMIDISERKLKEQAEKDRREEEQKRNEAEKKQEITEAKNQAKNQFFASMSHEFRTPLNAILGYTYIAKRKSTSEEERFQHLDTIEDGAQHMLQLINDVLDLSKIEAQKLEVEKVAINPFDLCSKIEGLVWVLATQKGIAFHLDYKLPLPRIILSDPLRLKQILTNLCSNAVKFTSNGSVSLKVYQQADKNLLCFAVEDSGIGLKPEALAKLFGAFSQADNSTARNYGGTGLGLYLSKIIANCLGGDISAQSEYGKGSIFTLQLNLDALQASDWVETPDDIKKSIAREIENKKITTSPELSAVEPLHKLNILIADDNDVNCKLLKFYLQQLGADVVIANDGREAIGRALCQIFDLILMDMEMPIMDGLTAVKYLRQIGYEAPVYALTGNVDAGSMAECEAAGCDGYLAKPIDVDSLRSVVNTVKNRTLN